LHQNLVQYCKMLDQDVHSFYFQAVHEDYVSLQLQFFWEVDA
jgi:hypothetical protein